MFSGVAFWQAPTAEAVAGLTYGRFVGVRLTGTNQRACWSNDGITWNVATTPNSNNYLGVDFSPELGLYVAVCENTATNNIISSTNGVTWTARSKPDNVQISGVKWCPQWSKFYASGLSKLYQSSDGINWSIAYTYSTGKQSVCFNPVYAETGTQSIFATTLYTGTSPNFLVWTCYTTNGSTFTEHQVSTITGAYGRTIAYSKANNRFLITEQALIPGTIFESQNIGSGWTNYTQAPPVTSSSGAALDWSESEGLFVRAYLTVPNSTTTPIVRSATGLSGSWTASTLPSAQYSIFNLRYAPEIDTWVAPQINTATGYSSTDGITWTSRTMIIDTRNVCWGAGIRTNGYKQGAGIT